MDALTELTLQIGGVAPSLLRELSGIYPTFVSAFKELISNAYDADATLVTVSFSPDLSSITVDDNGVGMTPFEFQQEYLRIGGSGQNRAQDVTAAGRQPIGRKGIGFLAAARYCRLIEISSHADKEAIFVHRVGPKPEHGSPKPQQILFFQGPFAPLLASYTRVQSVRCGAVELVPGDYRQDRTSIELSREAWSRFRGQTLSIQYSVDCRDVEWQAAIDYRYLLGLKDALDLGELKDFCRVRLVPHTDLSRSHVTSVKLYPHEFIQRELLAPQRKGRVRNIASASGLDRFLWQLSRSVPVSYSLSCQELEDYGLQSLVTPISPTPFTVQITDADRGANELRRPLLGEMYGDLDKATLVLHRVHLESDGLAARGYLLGFPRPVFPAELRGIAIRVRGVEIGTPGFLGVENSLPVRYRNFLNHIIGEVIVTEGLDAVSAIAPGRAGFYADSAQFQALRRYIVGDGEVEWGALGQVLGQLWEQHSVESSAARIVQDAKRRRAAFLDVSQALTAFSIGSRYGRSLRRLFSRTDIVADGLKQAPEYQAQLPGTIGGFSLEWSDLESEEYVLDVGHGAVRLNRDIGTWDSSVYILGRDFKISLRDGKPDDPVCEIDFETDTILINWMHPTRGKMGDTLFVKSAISWRTAYLAADGDVDLMMNLAHRLLSFTS